MGVEKEGSRGGGGYVGGFFQLFDWTTKSRKKLFSSKSDIPEHSKQGKRNDGNLPMTRATQLLPMDEYKTGGRLSIKGSSDYSCASSVADEEECGARAPGVVARLMGLDSMPSCSYFEPYPYFDAHSLQDAQYQRKNLDYQQKHQVYSGDLLNKVEDASWNFLEPKPQKLLNGPIKKFQTELLPPKSAKSIPVTHHKLLSPIKSPGFVPTKNAAYIMEAAARIIEPRPQPAIKANTPIVASPAVSLRVREFKDKVDAMQKRCSVGSSSVSSKVQDLKEKAEGFHRPPKLAEDQGTPESKVARYLREQALNKRWNRSMDTSFRAPTCTEDESALMNKGKSISLAIQAKVNVQRRDGLNQNGSKSLVSQKKEQPEVKPSQKLKSQPNVQKKLHNKSGHNLSSVLRQNNQKQNSISEKDKLTSKYSGSNPQGKKVLSGDSGHVHQKSSNSSTRNSKVGSRKLGLDLTDDKEILYASTNNFPRKKRSIERNSQFEKARAVNNLFGEKFPNPVQSNTKVDSPFNRSEDSKKKDIDIVSFTFTAPLTRKNLGFETSDHISQKSDALSGDHRIRRVLLHSDCNRSSPLGYNVLSGDALSILLEQKLRELTYGLESSLSDSFSVQSATDIASSSLDVSTSSTSVGLMPRSKQKNEVVDEMTKSRSNNVETQLFKCRHPSPISIFEPSFSAESCGSSITIDSNSTEGSKFCSSVQAQEVLTSSSSKKLYHAETDVELSDSASSTSTATWERSHSSTSITTRFTKSSTWELDYVKEILCNVELMYVDLSLGRACELINPHLFNLFRSCKRGVEIEGGESKLRRKVIFDCVCECLDLRCRSYVSGGYSMWVKGLSMVKRKAWLAEEVYREIASWRDMGDSMVDELVDKDMTSQYGRWMEFNADAFSLGIEIEGQVLNSLVDEVVADMLHI